jgi:hypothetical protein
MADGIGVGHPFGAHDQIFRFPFFCLTVALLFFSGSRLWRKNGSVVCSAICQWSESRRTHNHKLLSHLRLLGSLSVASSDSQGLRWKYYNPPPHGGSKWAPLLRNPTFETDKIENSVSSNSGIVVSISCQDSLPGYRTVRTCIERCCMKNLFL